MDESDESLQRGSGDVSEDTAASKVAVRTLPSGLQVLLGALAGVLMLLFLGIVNLIIPPLRHVLGTGEISRELIGRLIVLARFALPLAITVIAACRAMRKMKTFGYSMLIAALVIGTPALAYFGFIAITHEF